MFTDVELELPDGSMVGDPAELVHFNNARGESIMGVMLYPEVDTPAPAVVVLHGAGGLFTTPDSNDEKFETASQFSEWAEMLTNEGYVVLFPASFYSRGYFDWSDEPNGLDKKERLIFRTYDAHAALAFVCKQSQVDCDRVALLGFSNGASTTALSLHEGLNDVEGLERLPPAEERPRYALGVSYYPGCAFNGLVGLDVDSPDDYYFPSAPLRVNHATKDSLYDNCVDRLQQTEAVAERRNAGPSPMELRSYEGSGHGFDSSPSGSTEEQARDDARVQTLELFAAEL
jgi:dienelactone hydrolase